MKKRILCVLGFSKNLVYSTILYVLGFSINLVYSTYLYVNAALGLILGLKPCSSVYVQIKVNKLVKMTLIVVFWRYCVNHISSAFGIWMLRSSRTRGMGVKWCTLVRNAVFLVFFTQKSTIAFRLGMLHISRDRKGHKK